MSNYSIEPRRFYKRRAEVVFAMYIAVVHMHGPFPVISGASGVKNWHPPIGQTGRKGMSKREEERMRGGIESQCS
jgi:hypothetical protein